MRTPLPLFGFLLPLGGFGVCSVRLAFVAFAWLGLLPSAHAQAVEPIWYHSAVSAEEHPTSTAACQAELARMIANGANPATNVFDHVEEAGIAPVKTASCWLNQGPGFPTPFIYTNVAQRCPTGSTNQNGVCIAIPCLDQQGDTESVRFNVGWARSSDPNTADYIPPFTNPAGSTACKGGCQAIVGSTPTDAWRSQVPASNGLHRVSATFPMTYTGQQCTGGDTPALNPNTPPPPCPGFTGAVNGRPVCVGTPSAPLPTVPRAAPMPPEGMGNPPSGVPPSSGPGSGSDGPGVTPVSGDGGNAGGGSNAAIPGGGSEGNGQGSGTPQPTNPDGSTGSSTGAGEPTPIDEAGMPSGAGAYDGATAALNANRDQAVAGVNSAAAAAGKSTSWSFSFALPTGCSPIPLAGFEPYLSGIDICSYQPLIHDLMTLLWLAATVFACIGMVGRAVGGGSS